jgi:hypothetical protein
MECQVRTLTFSTHRSRSGRSFAVVDLNPSTLRPADTDMDIPHPNIALSAIDVPLDPDGANGSRNSGDDHVADLGLASVTGIAHLTGTVRVVIKSYRTCIYLEDGNGIVDVCEFGSRSKDGGPEFSRDNRASGDVDCVLDDVGASIEI